eukprot:5435-Rhodomonas_salina.5
MVALRPRMQCLAYEDSANTASVYGGLTDSAHVGARGAVLTHVRAVLLVLLFTVTVRPFAGAMLLFTEAVLPVTGAHRHGAWR